MKIRQDSSGRVQPTEYRNLIHPGQCLLCARIGRTPDEVFANLGVELEFYGIAYLCTDCCMECASFVGAVDSEQWDKYRQEATAHIAEYDRLVAEVKILRSALDARVTVAIDRLLDKHGNDDLSVPEDESAAEGFDRLLKQDESEPS